MNKKNLIIIAMLLSSFICLNAETIKIGTTFKKKHSGQIGDTLKRAPINLPIEVTFDDVTGVLTVSAPEDMEGCVYVYNVNGALEGSSQTLNATFTLSTSGMHVIAIEGDSWIGEGRIIL